MSLINDSVQERILNIYYRCIARYKDKLLDLENQKESKEIILYKIACLYSQLGDTICYDYIEKALFEKENLTKHMILNDKNLLILNANKFIDILNNYFDDDDNILSISPNYKYYILEKTILENSEKINHVKIYHRGEQESLFCFKNNNKETHKICWDLNNRWVMIKYSDEEELLKKLIFDLENKNSYLLSKLEGIIVKDYNVTDWLNGYIDTNEIKIDTKHMGKDEFVCEVNKYVLDKKEEKINKAIDRVFEIKKEIKEKLKKLDSLKYDSQTYEYEKLNILEDTFTSDKLLYHDVLVSDSDLLKKDMVNLLHMIVLTKRNIALRFFKNNGIKVFLERTYEYLKKAADLDNYQQITANIWGETLILESDILESSEKIEVLKKARSKLNEYGKPEIINIIKIAETYRRQAVVTKNIKVDLIYNAFLYYQTAISNLLYDKNVFIMMINELRNLSEVIIKLDSIDKALIEMFKKCLEQLLTKVELFECKETLKKVHFDLYYIYKLLNNESKSYNSLEKSLQYGFKDREVVLEIERKKILNRKRFSEIMNRYFEDNKIWKITKNNKVLIELNRKSFHSNLISTILTIKDFKKNVYIFEEFEEFSWDCKNLHIDSNERFLMADMKSYTDYEEKRFVYDLKEKITYRMNHIEKGFVSDKLIEKWISGELSKELVLNDENNIKKMKVNKEFRKTVEKYFDYEQKIKEIQTEINQMKIENNLLSMPNDLKNKFINLKELLEDLEINMNRKGIKTKEYFIQVSGDLKKGFVRINSKIIKDVKTTELVNEKIVIDSKILKSLGNKLEMFFVSDDIEVNFGIRNIVTNEIKFLYKNKFFRERSFSKTINFFNESNLIKRI